MVQPSLNQFNQELQQKGLAALGLQREQIDTVIAQRQQARADKDWAKSDELRDELITQGVQILDAPDGSSSWKLNIDTVVSGVLSNLDA